MALNKARGAEAIGSLSRTMHHMIKHQQAKKNGTNSDTYSAKESPVQEIMMTDSEAGGGTGGGFITFLSEHYRRG